MSEAATCTIHDHTSPVRADFIDFPTAWRIQCEGLTHVHPKCSALQTDGALLCDCAALHVEWESRVRHLRAHRPTTDDHPHDPELAGERMRTIGPLVEASSLGTPKAKVLRESVPDEVSDRVMQRARVCGPDQDTEQPRLYVHHALDGREATEVSA